MQGKLFFLLGDSALQLTEKNVASHPPSYIQSSTGLREVTDSGLPSFGTNRIPSRRRDLRVSFAQSAKARLEAPKDQARGSKAWLEASKAWLEIWFEAHKAWLDAPKAWPEALKRGSEDLPEALGPGP